MPIGTANAAYNRVVDAAISDNGFFKQLIEAARSGGGRVLAVLKENAQLVGPIDSDLPEVAARVEASLTRPDNEARVSAVLAGIPPLKGVLWPE